MGELKEDLLLAAKELRETHISWVFLTESEVYKVKKPVALGFLDFTTPEKRRRACEAEVELNRRLAPDVYLGVEPVVASPSGRKVIGGPGPVVDWAVRMKRLPDEDRADRRLAESRLGLERIASLARRLALFHARARSDETTARWGTVEAIEVNLRENFAQTKEHILDHISQAQAEEVRDWQLRFLDEARPHFEQRARAGRIRDGHGDLRLEHVYFSEDGDGEELRILDCIEFNERFRFADVCADLVFLAMDLAWHGRPDMAEYLLACYARESNDYDLYRLVDFYESYRAFVRGKISSMVAGDPHQSQRGRHEAAAEARRYFLLALASERRPLRPPTVWAVGGLIASGKSTVAEALSRELPATVVSSDRTRKFMAGVESDTRLREEPWRGVYAPRFTERVYDELFRRAGVVIDSGRTVVLDASFRTRELRARAQGLADAAGVAFRFVECMVPEAVAAERLEKRAGRPKVSDARVELLQEFEDKWEPVDELQAPRHFRLDTSRPLDATLATLRKEILAGRPAGPSVAAGLRETGGRRGR